MNPRYFAADKLLSPKTIEAIRTALDINGKGALIWIPAKGKPRRKRRDDNIRALHHDGWKPAQIAEIVFCSERTVRRVLRDCENFPEGAPPPPIQSRPQPEPTNPEISIGGIDDVE